jgi:predicted dehydrogenase
MSIRIGLIGFGNQAKNHHARYLKARQEARRDVEIAWISGYLPGLEMGGELQEWLDSLKCACHPGEAWRKLLVEAPVDAVVISTPNFLHADQIRESLERGTHIAVDKPTTINPADCKELVQTAADRKVLFATLAQRRYEDIYQTMKEIIDRGGVGTPVLIQYLMTHEHFSRGKKMALPQNPWVVFALVSGATVAFTEAWLGRSMAGRKKVALAL